MNERILSPQLLKLVQAAGPGYSLADPEWIKKFAELIVRECVKNLETNKRCDIYTGELTDCDWNDVIQHQINSLKEHFGVEK